VGSVKALKEQTLLGLSAERSSTFITIKGAGMHWDDELERLVHKTSDYFGADVLWAATRRAIEHAKVQLRSCEGKRTRVFPPGAFENALRIELRQLVRPH
jgi:hypothetical protein